MGRNSTTIPVSCVIRILKKNGANRVSKNAATVLESYLEDFAKTISKRAIEFAAHSGRTTIMESDVKLAAKE